MDTKVLVKIDKLLKRFPETWVHTRQTETVGGVISKEGPIHLSNVMLTDPSDGKPTRVGFEVHEGKRYRVAKRTGKRID